jgi:hypothetical protein
MKFLGLGYEFQDSCMVCMKTYFRYFTFHVFFSGVSGHRNNMLNSMVQSAWISLSPRCEGPLPCGSDKVQNSGHDLPKFSLCVCAHVRKVLYNVVVD